MVGMSKKIYKAASAVTMSKTDKPGRFMGVVIADPAVKPKNTTVTAIRKAVKAANQKRAPAI